MLKLIQFLVCIIPALTYGNDVRSSSELYHHPTENFKCIKCKIGEYVSKPCTEDLGYSLCEQCNANEYVGDGGATSCALCTVCSNTNKKFVWKNCSKDVNTVCFCGPNETSTRDDYCEKCQPPKVVYRSDDDVGGKCDYCKSGKFYNTAVSACTKCTECGLPGTKILCNSTHDSVCITTLPLTTTTPMPTTASAATDNGLSDGAKAGIVIGTLILLIILALFIVFIIYKRNDRCREILSQKCSCISKPREETSDPEEGMVREPLCSKKSEPESKSQSKTNGVEHSPLVSPPEETDGPSSLVASLPGVKDEVEPSSLVSSPPEVKYEEHPAWINPMVTLLCNNLSEPAECLTGLTGTANFRGSVIYQQIYRSTNANFRLTAQYFLERWVAARPEANHVEEIIVKLKEQGEEELTMKIYADNRIDTSGIPSHSNLFNTVDRNNSDNITSAQVNPVNPESGIQNSNNHRSLSSSSVLPLADENSANPGHNSEPSLNLTNDMSEGDNACSNVTAMANAHISMSVKVAEKSKARNKNVESMRYQPETNHNTRQDVIDRHESLQRIGRPDRDVDAPSDSTTVHYNGHTGDNSVIHPRFNNNGTETLHFDHADDPRNRETFIRLQGVAPTGQGHSPSTSGKSVSQALADLPNGSSPATNTLNNTDNLQVHDCFLEKPTVECAEDTEQTHPKWIE